MKRCVWCGDSMRSVWASNWTNLTTVKSLICNGCSYIVEFEEITIRGMNMKGASSLRSDTIRPKTIRPPFEVALNREKSVPLSFDNGWLLCGLVWPCEGEV